MYGHVYSQQEKVWLCEYNTRVRVWLSETTVRQAVAVHTVNASQAEPSQTVLGWHGNLLKVDHSRLIRLGLAHIHTVPSKAS